MSTNRCACIYAHSCIFRQQQRNIRFVILYRFNFPYIPRFSRASLRSLAGNIRSIGKALGLGGVEDNAIEINRFDRTL